MSPSRAKPQSEMTMNINDLMGELGITPEQPEQQPPSSPRSAPRRRKATPATDSTPKAESASRDVPEPGKVYRLTGENSIASGASLADAEVRPGSPLGRVETRVPGAPGAYVGAPNQSAAQPETADEFAPKKGDRVRYANPRARAVFKAGQGRRAHARDGLSVPVGTEGVILWEGFGHYGQRLMVKADDGAVWRTSASNCEAVSNAQLARAELRAGHDQGADARPAQALAERVEQLQETIAKVEAIEPEAADAAEQLQDALAYSDANDAAERELNGETFEQRSLRVDRTILESVETLSAPTVRELPDVLEQDRATISLEQELDAAFGAFRLSRDLGDAARLQKAMTAILQAQG